MASISLPLRFAARPASGAAAEEDVAARPLTWVLAALSFAAGVIHLAMVPSHYGEWAVEGVGFAVAGWAQIALAAAVLLTPRRIVLSSLVVSSGGLIGAWALSRTAGLPWGPHAWHAEAATFIDVSCVAFEAGAIAVASAMLLRPSLALPSGVAMRGLALAGAAGVLAVATAALASPSARDHAAGAHGEHAAHGNEDDRGLSLLTNGHHHDIVQQELDPQTQAALDAQLRQTRQVARRYPTVADAEAAGYRRAGPYAPGIGAHYIKYGAEELNADGTVDGDDVMRPLALIYDGTEHDAAIAGFMYYSLSATEPEGFIGPNDTWHYHENLCLRFGANGVIDAPFGPDNAATQEQCASVGGTIIPSTTWMLHVWSVAGYDDVEGGTFAEVNPGLDCPDGTYYQLPPEEWAANPLNICRSR